MAGPPAPHAPSRYRGILREAKRVRNDRDVRALVGEARRLPDPYFVSKALLALSEAPQIPLRDAVAVAGEALAAARRVEPPWRLAELVGDLLKQATPWRPGAHGRDVEAAREGLGGEVLAVALAIPAGEGRSQAVQAVANRLPLSDTAFRSLLEAALGNPGFEAADAKAVLRGWVQNAPARAGADRVRQAVTVLDATAPPGLRPNLLGYLHLQARKRLQDQAPDAAFEAALFAAEGLPDGAARLDALRYLATLAETEETLIALHARVGALEGAEARARFLSTLGGHADKRRRARLARDWLREGLHAASGVQDPAARAAVRANLAEGLARAGAQEAGANALAQAVQDALGLADEKPRVRALQRIRAAADRARIGLPEGTPGPTAPERASEAEAPGPHPPDAVRSGVSQAANALPAPHPSGAVRRASSPKEEASATSRKDSSRSRPEGSREPDRRSGESAVYPEHALPAAVAAGAPAPAGDRPVLALYDTYEGGIKQTHLRAVARAAPLCYAFDLDLALIGFPTRDLEGFVDQVVRDTRVGGGGRYLSELAQAGRVLLVPATSREPPGDWRRLGLPVATTSKPDPAKAATLESALSEARNRPGRKSVCLVMGLGKRGLPPAQLEAAGHHLELTGRRASLETATAMGVIAERLRAARERNP